MNTYKYTQARKQLEKICRFVAFQSAVIVITMGTTAYFLVGV
jgi:hydrogenase-4 membrane subunit HyfE